MRGIFKQSGLILGTLLLVSLVMTACGEDNTPAAAPAASGTPVPISVGKDSQPVTLVASNTPTPVNGTPITTASGLQYIELRVGTGATARANHTVHVNYAGWLTANGTKFDSSLDRHQDFSFVLGAGSVIPGWDEGVQGMKVGGLRRLLIPSKLGYGPAAVGAVIPPNADLTFDVELEAAN